MPKTIPIFAAIFCLAFPSGALALPGGNEDGPKAPTPPIEKIGKDRTREATGVVLNTIAASYKAPCRKADCRITVTPTFRSGNIYRFNWMLRGKRVFESGRAEVVDLGRMGWRITLG